MSKSKFKDIKESTNLYDDKIIKIAEVLGLGSPRTSGDSLQMCCPNHYENNPSYGINTINGTFNCFACGFKGHIKQLPYLLRSNILAEKIDSIEDYEVTAKVDTVSYSAKPKGSNVGSIRNRLTTVPLKKYTIKELLAQIVKGHTISLSGAKKNEEWQGQQVVMIDIDNDYQVTMTDIIDYAKSIGLEPTFAYHTYNSTENCCRCRLAYVFKEPITDKQEYQDILKRLIREFGDYGVDPACDDLCRMFYGTMNTDVYISNLVYYNRFTSEQINEVERIIGNGHRINRSCASDKRSVTAASSINSEEVDISQYRDGKKFRHDLFAKDLMSEYNFITLNTLPHFYRDGLYVNNNNREIEKLIKMYLPSLGIHNVKEVLNDLALFSEEKEETDYHTLAFRNGLVDIENPVLKPFSSDVILTSRLNVDFVDLNIETCSNPTVDKFFSDVTDRR